MTQDDLLARIQLRGRLHGRNESRRVAAAVLTVLGELLPAPAYRRLIDPLPGEVRHRLPEPDTSRIVEIVDLGRFLTRIAERLYVDGPDGAFLTRVVLGELNTAGFPVGPADVAHLVSADLRPLLRSRAPTTTETPTIARRATL
ncbi:DUF2267 domain-containing protein [Actinoplanes sp. NPDC051851]|uniref:DUF2267 domain-containing protein n=1 Tax=Actinoplanes sp. NPDC051851 TaxID=3154753 RepID=UPI00341D6A7B